MRIQTAPNTNHDALEPLRQVYALATQILAPIDGKSTAFQAVMEAIALARMDLVAQSLKKFVNANGERLPLFSRGIILHLAAQLQKGDMTTLSAAGRQLQEYHFSLGLGSVGRLLR